LRSGAVR